MPSGGHPAQPSRPHPGARRRRGTGERLRLSGPLGRGGFRRRRVHRAAGRDRRRRVFVSAVREAVLDGRADVAVHSLKDLPTADEPGVDVVAVPAREDARDALCAGVRPSPSSRLGRGWEPARRAGWRSCGNCDPTSRRSACGATSTVGWPEWATTSTRCCLPPQVWRGWAGWRRQTSCSTPRRCCPHRPGGVGGGGAHGCRTVVAGGAGRAGRSRDQGVCWLSALCSRRWRRGARPRWAVTPDRRARLLGAGDLSARRRLRRLRCSTHVHNRNRGRGGGVRARTRGLAPAAGAAALMTESRL